jgi:hypothetical protein
MVAVSELVCSGCWDWAGMERKFFRSLRARLRLAEVRRDTRALAGETALELGMGKDLRRIKWRAP